MKWYAISGSWRITNDEVKRDVERTVEKIILAGDGIITGGALGIDYFATNVVLKKGDSRRQLKLYLPIKLENLCKHFFKRAEEGVITREQAEMVTSQWREVERICGDCISDEWGYTEANIESYYGRNTRIVEDCDVLYAFHVNDSKGTQDAIDKAKELGKEARVKKYYVEVN
ncbi:hypothetical protein K8R33_05175 [archaeon]|nr:hypothetical protein [archaeon]